MTVVAAAATSSRLFSNEIPRPRGREEENTRCARSHHQRFGVLLCCTGPARPELCCTPEWANAGASRKQCKFSEIFNENSITSLGRENSYCAVRAAIAICNSRRRRQFGTMNQTTMSTTMLIIIRRQICILYRKWLERLHHDASVICFPPEAWHIGISRLVPGSRHSITFPGKCQYQETTLCSFKPPLASYGARSTYYCGSQKSKYIYGQG